MTRWTWRHDTSHLQPLQQLSGRVRTQECQSPPKQSYLYNDRIWKGTLASRSFISDQMHREIAIACRIAADICCCSWWRYNALGRGKRKEVRKLGRNLLASQWKGDASLVLTGSWLLPYLKICQFVSLSNRQENALFSEEQCLRTTILQYFGLKIPVCVEKNGQGN